MTPDRLEEYRGKRSFEVTPEPSGKSVPSPGDENHFVVQKHDARRLHYDFRLEADGVLVSWAVPRGPSYDPKEKRLAVHVEDHPLDYETFEGIIPEAQYGAGTVVVWDRGTYRNLTQRRGKPVPVTEAVRAGHLSVWLEGSKLRGGWSLTRTGSDDKSWLLVKRSDEHADPTNDVTARLPESVISGRQLSEVASEPSAPEWTRETATWMPPMLAQALKQADIATVAGPEWQYERKLDGLRCIAVRNGSEVSLWSRNHLPFTARFPSVVAALGRLPADNFTIDGELVAFVGGRTSFARLQRPDGSTEPVFCVFDLLHLLGQDTTALPLEDRQSLLAKAVEDAGEAISVVDRLTGNIADLLGQACENGWEGLLAKRLSAPYQSGRTPDWRKLKCSASQELVVVGWTDPSGSRAGFGALLLGYFDDAGSLHYAGKVGTGFDDRTLRQLHARLKELERATPSVDERVREKGAHWVAPELVAAVSFSEWTSDGRLRHPSFLGIRRDKDPREVRREDLP